MSRAARFDIFYQGRLYRKNLTAAEITKEFGCKSAMVYQAANTGHKINRVFEVKKMKRIWKISTKLRYLIILAKNGEDARKLLKMSYG